MKVYKALQLMLCIAAAAMLFAGFGKLFTTMADRSSAQYREARQAATQAGNRAKSLYEMQSATVRLYSPGRGEIASWEGASDLRSYNSGRTLSFVVKYRDEHQLKAKSVTITGDAPIVIEQEYNIGNASHVEHNEDHSTH